MSSILVLSGIFITAVCITIWCCCSGSSTICLLLLFLFVFSFCLLIFCIFSFFLCRPLFVLKHQEFVLCVFAFFLYFAQWSQCNSDGETLHSVDLCPVPWQVQHVTSEEFVEFPPSTRAAFAPFTSPSTVFVCSVYISDTSLILATESSSSFTSSTYFLAQMSFHLPCDLTHSPRNHNFGAINCHELRSIVQAISNTKVRSGRMFSGQSLLQVSLDLSLLWFCTYHIWIYGTLGLWWLWWSCEQYSACAESAKISIFFRLNHSCMYHIW